MTQPLTIVLDGLNGVGKSATARILSALLGIPIVRPFRHQDMDRHLGRESGRGVQRSLRDLGIPANTFVDDIYAADLITALGASALLDRSMPSAIAYGMLYKDVRDLDHALALTDVWQALWDKYGGRLVYVYMTADVPTMSARCEGRWAPSPVERSQLDQTFRLVYRWLNVRKIRVDTTELATPEATAHRITELLRAEP